MGCLVPRFAMTFHRSFELGSRPSHPYHPGKEDGDMPIQSPLVVVFPLSLSVRGSLVSDCFIMYYASGARVSGAGTGAVAVQVRYDMKPYRRPSAGMLRALLASLRPTLHLSYGYSYMNNLTQLPFHECHT